MYSPTIKDAEIGDTQGHVPLIFQKSVFKFATLHSKGLQFLNVRVAP